MVTGLITTLTLTWLVNALLSSAAGFAIVRRKALQTWVGVVPGLLLPWLGLFVPAAMRPAGAARLTGAPARSGLPLVGVSAVVVGALLVLASTGFGYVSASGKISAAGLSQYVGDLREELTLGPAQSTLVMTLVVIVTVANLGLAYGAWHRGGLRFALPGLFAGAFLSSILMPALIGVAAAADYAGIITWLTGGHAEANLSIGTGAQLAACGQIFIVLGWMCVVLGRTQEAAPQTGFALRRHARRQAAAPPVTDPFAGTLPQPTDTSEGPPSTPPWGPPGFGTAPGCPPSAFPSGGALPPPPTTGQLRAEDW